jgi:hypothetical protein
MAIAIISRKEWGARPPTRPLTPVKWKSGPLWAHHTVGNYVKPDFGDDATWLRQLAEEAKTPGKYAAHLVRQWRMLKARNDAVKKQTVAAEKKAMREIQRFHQGKSRGWADIGYAYVVFPSGRIYEGRGKHVGAHCPGHNSEPSCAFAGDYSKVAPTERAVRAFDELRKQLRMVGWRGHRDGFPTSCPGDALYGALRRLIPRG